MEVLRGIGVADGEGGVQVFLGQSRLDIAGRGQGGASPHLVPGKGQRGHLEGGTPGRQGAYTVVRRVQGPVGYNISKISTLYEHAHEKTSHMAFY